MPKNTIVPSDWLSRSALNVAPDLIGCTLVRQFSDDRLLRGTIVETEAYEEGDPACHAYRKRTDRNAIIFGPAGYIYVYLIYGMYHCVNIVTDRDNFASAVLIRALHMETLSPELMKPTDKPDRIAAGPGKLCRVMAIDRALNKMKLGQQVPIGHPMESASKQIGEQTAEQTDGYSALWIEHRSTSWQKAFDNGTIQLVQTTRIGLTQGIDLPWRWYLKDSPSVSKI